MKNEIYNNNPWASSGDALVPESPTPPDGATLDLGSGTGFWPLRTH